MIRAAFAVIALALPALAAEPISVPGSEIAFVPGVQQKANGKIVNMSITGTALRTKTILNVKVYGMASYVLEGTTVKTAEELAAAETVKLFHLVMERKVSGTDFVNAFREAVGDDRVKKEFAAEFQKLKDAVGAVTADKGENVLMLYVPEAGTRIRIGEAVDVTIPGAAFGKAIWETYLGPKPIDGDIKKGLVSQIAK